MYLNEAKDIIKYIKDLKDKIVRITYWYDRYVYCKECIDNLESEVMSFIIYRKEIMFTDATETAFYDPKGGPKYTKNNLPELKNFLEKEKSEVEKLCGEINNKILFEYNLYKISEKYKKYTATK